MARLKFKSPILLNAAALLVPKSQKEDWLAEWTAEVWHIRTGGDENAHRLARGTVLRFCLGSFQDAWILRGGNLRASASFAFRSGAPMRCILLLITLAVISALICLATPSFREIFQAQRPDSLADVPLVSQEGQFTVDEPTVAFSDYAAWKDGGAKAFRGLVFYRPDIVSAYLPEARSQRQSQQWRAGYASMSLLSLLPRSSIGGAALKVSESRKPLAILSRKTWTQTFHSDLQIVGRTIQVGTQMVTVGGVDTDAPWALPGRVDLLLLEPDAALATFFASSRGYVLAPAISPALEYEEAQEPFILVQSSSGQQQRFECLTLAHRRLSPIALFFFSLLLSCVALPATTSVLLGDYPSIVLKSTFWKCVRRWTFLAIKLACVLVLCLLVPLFLSVCLAIPGSAMAAYWQLALSFSALLMALRWAIRDQQRRCPVCLRCLSHPALVGHASRCFLAWSGTEMLCVGGHGFLYIPEHPTSWFATQRWLSADRSWAGLFASDKLS